VLSFIATQIVSAQDKEEMMHTFKSLDKDGDGKLTKEELVDGIKIREKLLKYFWRLY